MAEVHRLSRTDARRIAVAAQLLGRERPADPVEVVDQLTALQIDQTKAVAPSADLVLWSRLGSTYDRRDLSDALDRRELVELRGYVRPAADLALYRADMAAFAAGEVTGWQLANVTWVRDNAGFRRDLLQQLREDGPLPARDLRDTAVRPWKSSGWNNDKNVQMMLEQLIVGGEVAVAGRDEKGRLFDLAERVYPADPVVPAPQAYARREQRRLRALGIARAKRPADPVESWGVGPAGEPAVIDGIRGSWRVDPELLGQPFRGRAALLSPFDRLVFDRQRIAEIFEFDYTVEMYKPKAKRRWGYFALPVLYGDRLVGKLDATADPAEGELRVDALHRDVDFSAAMIKAVDHEIDDLGRWLGLEVARLDRTT